MRIISFVNGGSVRANLLRRLVTKAHTPSELATIEGKHVSHVSRALGELRRMGLVERIDAGSRERFYKLTIEGMVLFYTISRQK